jgi:hypothetical protein
MTSTDHIDSQTRSGRLSNRPAQSSLIENSDEQYFLRQYQRPIRPMHVALSPPETHEAR